MCKHDHKKTDLGKKPIIYLDTLAQLGTPYLQPSDNAHPRILTFVQKEDLKNPEKSEEKEDFPTLNKGTLFNDFKVWHKAQKRKFLSSGLAHGLVVYKEAQHKTEIERSIELGKSQKTIYRLEKEYNQQRKSYWNHYFCSSILEKEGDKVTRKYCKSRLCMQCNNMRSGELMRNYENVLNTWLKEDELYFVTLTAKTVLKEDLKNNIQERFHIFKQIQDTLRKRHQRKNSDYPKFEGLRKLECTYNPINKKFHPHFHVLVRGKKQAQDLLNLWIKKADYLGIDSKAQDLVKADKGATKELFKYFTKVISSASKTDPNRAIYLDAVDTIFLSIKGKRTFQNFGFKISDYNTKEVEPTKEAEPTKEEQIEAIQGGEPPELFDWNPKLNDWQSRKTGELVSKEPISNSLKDICNNMKLPTKYSDTLIKHFIKNRKSTISIDRDFKEINHLTEEEKRTIAHQIEAENLKNSHLLSSDRTPTLTEKVKSVLPDKLRIGNIIKVRDNWVNITNIRFNEKNNINQLKFTHYLIEYNNVFQVVLGLDEITELQ